MQPTRINANESDQVNRALLQHIAQCAIPTQMHSVLNMVDDLAGCFSGTPPDLSSNHAYLADFGRDLKSC